MASPVPKSVSAALGVVPAVLGGVRRLPQKAVQLPVIAVSSGLAGLDRARREYDELAERGERLVARLRGTSFDELEDRVEDALPKPIAGLYEKVEDTLEDVADAVRNNPKPAVKKAAQAVAKTTQQAADRAEAEAAVQEVLPGTGKGAPTPKATEPDSTRIDTAATPDVVQAVEQVAGNAAVPSADELPLADYDHMTLGALRGRLRSLSVDQLVQLRAYEKSKADRLPVVTMLDNRIAKLAAGDGSATGNVPEEPSAKASTATKPPKKMGSTASAKNDNSPPHSKVRYT
ncbi:MAG: hypothetical protein LC789_01740 [Actinobacteria bacterium]|nr:hypothetical protein [Actinomycetota bacterium]MCA1722069.1 hypothetical protein [Actinomycetota bacterium]